MKTVDLPLSLRRTEQEILNELQAANIKLNFAITAYSQDSSQVDYRLTSTQMPLECTFNQAKTIVDSQIAKWKTKAQ